MQSLVKIALQFPHRFVQNFPTDKCLIGLHQDLRKSGHVLPHLQSGEFYRLHSKTQASPDFPEGAEDVLNNFLLLGRYLGQLYKLVEIVLGLFEDLPSLEERIELGLRLLRVLAGEDAIQVPA